MLIVKLYVLWDAGRGCIREGIESRLTLPWLWVMHPLWSVLPFACFPNSTISSPVSRTALASRWRPLFLLGDRSRVPIWADLQSLPEPLAVPFQLAIPRIIKREKLPTQILLRPV